MPFAKKRPDGLTARIDVRVSPEEKEQIRAVASSAGLDMSELMRRRALGRPVIPKTDATMLREFRRLGGLLKHVHNQTGGTFKQQTWEVLVALQAATKAVAEADQVRGVGR